MRKLFNHKSLTINHFLPGFTLAEITIALFIIVSVGGLIVGIFYSTLRGTNKSNVIQQIRQDGNGTMTQMTKMIRSAKTIDSVCDGTSRTSVTFTSFDDRQTTFQCPPSAAAPIASVSASASVPLLEVNNARVTSCSFTCNQAAQEIPPTVTINFTLAQRSTDAAVVQSADQTTSIPFETSVTVRNYFR